VNPVNRADRWLEKLVFLLATLLASMTCYGVSSWDEKGSGSTGGGIRASEIRWQDRGRTVSALQNFSPVNQQDQLANLTALPGWSPSKQSHEGSALDRSLAIDRVLVMKSAKKLFLMTGKRVFREYPIVLGKNPVGHKVQEGDGRTPEGQYVLDWRNPGSKFYRSIHISYPNDQDLAQAEANNRDPGKHIMIHGSPAWVPSVEWAKQWLQQEDWTDGCIAVTNDVMDEIWQLVKDGTPIEIQP
jgi:L,D-transpeptidase catalytic domain